MCTCMVLHRSNSHEGQRLGSTNSEALVSPKAPLQLTIQRQRVVSGRSHPIRTTIGTKIDL